MRFLFDDPLLPILRQWIDMKELYMFIRLGSDSYSLGLYPDRLHDRRQWTRVVWNWELKSRMISRLHSCSMIVIRLHCFWIQRLHRYPLVLCGISGNLVESWYMPQWTRGVWNWELKSRMISRQNSCSIVVILLHCFGIQRFSGIVWYFVSSQAVWLNDETCISGRAVNGRES